MDGLLGGAIFVERRTQRRHDQLQIQLDKERAALKGRHQVISSAMQAVAKSLPSFHWGVLSDDDKNRNRP
ncbi:hypothetical protein, partial [Chryseobacterium sp. SIMBA_028]